MSTDILHISDTHLGKRQYRSEARLNDYADAFEQSVDTAIELDVDAVLHTGDLFDAPNPNVPVVNNCLDIVHKLDTANIPFLGIVGNHERKRDQQWLDLVDRFDMVERLDRTPRIVDGDGGPVAIYGIDAVRRPAWQAADFTLTPHERPAQTTYTLLAMHELLSPPVPDHMADYETATVLERLGMDVDGLALGDYHEPSRDQVEDTAVWYPGSTEKTARDESEDHYVNRLSVDAGELTTHKHRVAGTRPFVEFTITFEETDGLAHARRNVEKYELSGTDQKDAVGIARLAGANTGVTPKNVHRLLTENGAAVTQVVDDRGQVDTDDLDVESVDTTEIETMIDSGVEKMALSQTSQALESLIRDNDIAKSNLRDEAADILDTAREQSSDR